MHLGDKRGPHKIPHACYPNWLHILPCVRLQIGCLMREALALSSWHGLGVALSLWIDRSMAHSLCAPLTCRRASLVDHNLADKNSHLQGMCQLLSGKWIWMWVWKPCFRLFIHNASQKRSTKPWRPCPMHLNIQPRNVIHFNTHTYFYYTSRQCILDHFNSVHEWFIATK